MKRSLKIILLMVCLFIFSGFTNGDWSSLNKKYKTILESTNVDNYYILCDYKHTQGTSDKLWFSHYRLYVYHGLKEANNNLYDGIYDRFDDGNNNPLIAEKNSNTQGIYTYNNKRILYSNFSFDDYFNAYASKNKCPALIYFCPSSKLDSNSTDLELLFDPNGDTTYTHSCSQFVEANATEEEIHPNGCYYDGAKSCKQYTKSVGSKTLYVELGMNNSGRNYAMFSYDSDFSEMAASPNMEGNVLATMSNGDSIVVMKDDNNKDFFDYNCKNGSCNYPSNVNIIYGCSGYNYFYYLFDNNSSYEIVNFGGINPTSEKCEKQVESGEDITPPKEQNCESLLGNPKEASTPAFYLTKAFQIIKYVGIVILAVMSLMDFLTAITSNDKEALNKAAKKTMIRFILCVVLFLLPTIINFVLTYLNDKATDLCGIG